MPESIDVMDFNKRREEIDFAVGEVSDGGGSSMYGKTKSPVGISPILPRAGLQNWFKHHRPKHGHDGCGG